ncbi:DJ-1/PfpI family protein [Bacillus rhizoplanae]|uniref:DJ-1/PfpI family protein n=1 Tax=Bacillus rhizoplanae TaxID=2880966 RepID=UPI003D243C8B
MAYPNYADFEIAHTLFFLRKKGKARITTATIDGNFVISLGGLQTQADAGLAEIDVKKYDLVLISGGDGIDEVMNEETIHTLLQEAASLHIPIASICASAVLLGRAGLLAGKKFTCLLNTHATFQEVFIGSKYTGTNIEIQEGLITAKGTAFAEFTVAVGGMLGLWKNNEESSNVLRFCKGEV